MVWICRTLLKESWGIVGNGKALAYLPGQERLLWSTGGCCGAWWGPSDCDLSPFPTSPQDNASKLLLALMESRHDSENAERILISLRPQELVRLGPGSGWEGVIGVVWRGDWGIPYAPGKRRSDRQCPARWTSSRKPTCRRRSGRTQR